MGRYNMQKGLNNQKIQQTNRSLILEMIIDRGIVTRKEMIDLTGLHKPTITNIVNELLEMNVIEECEVPRKEGQRKVVGFALKTQKIKILSARWARDFFEVALYTLSGEIIDSERCAVNPEEEIELTANKKFSCNLSFAGETSYQSCSWYVYWCAWSIYKSRKKSSTCSWIR